MSTANPTAIANDWLRAFAGALEQRNVPAVTATFGDDCYWRDLVSFTWNIVTLEGQNAIAGMLERALVDLGPANWQVVGEPTEEDDAVAAWLQFETKVGRGTGYVRLREGKAWTLFTMMKELKGFEEKKGPTRPKGVEHGAFANRKSWLERRTVAETALGYTEQPYCVIVGGGQAGIALGARLRRLEVPTIILERNERPGDSWRSRYRSLCLHDPVWYDHMPYLPFPDDWPVYSPKDKIGDWLEMYAKVMELNFWGSTDCKRATFDETTETWTVDVVRRGKAVTLQPRHLVLATGVHGVPHVPSFPGSDRFQGEQHHSSQYKGPEGYQGKHCVIVGSCNSAHDIAADLWEHGAHPTMIQRSATTVVSAEAIAEIGLGALYSEEALEAGITTDKADLLSASMPFRLLAPIQVERTRAMKARDAELLAGLERAGFLLDFGEDDSGLSMKFLRRGSGYYIDVGASKLIADGKIKLQAGVGVAELKERSVVLTDGTELSADLIVYATGYGSMNGWAARLISREVADKVGKCWGLGSATKNDPGPWEGEERNMWKPTHQEALWFHGGNLQQSRFYSQCLALQLKARMEGLPTPVVGMQPVHHLV